MTERGVVSQVIRIESLRALAISYRRARLHADAAKCWRRLVADYTRGHVFKGNVMSNETPTASDPGPLRHFRVGRRALLTSLAGAGVAAIAMMPPNTDSTFPDVISFPRNLILS